MRGKHVTKPIEEVVREARELAADGVRELSLVAQDMTYYGLDLYGRPRLADLLRALDAVEGIDWIRVLYNYPQHVSNDLIQSIRESPKVVPYLDMPLQHISDRMLKLMNRRHDRSETVEIIERLRAGIPDLVLRTTFVVGFPGETEADFEELREFVAATRFERLGVFPYSYEADTPSARLPGHLDDEVKHERRDAIMAEQQPIAFAFNASLVGRTLDVLLDRADPAQKGRWVGRTYADAPDIDGVVSVRGRGLRPGDLVACEITEAVGYDLSARAVGSPRRQGGGTGRAASKGRLPNASLLPIIS
jgi:ribosomal protein S12 methylthiotransferase